MVIFIKSVNQSSIKPCLIVHLVAVWTLIYFEFLLLCGSTFLNKTNDVEGVSRVHPGSFLPMKVVKDTVHTPSSLFLGDQGVAMLCY